MYRRPQRDEICGLLLIFIFDFKVSYMQLLTFKAIHIIGFVAWFAGLFYLVRLFVYHAEALQLPEQEKAVLTPQYSLMEKRLFTIIVRPGMILTFAAGIAMLIVNPHYLSETWLHIKLVLVVILAGYSDRCGRIIRQLATGEFVMSSGRFRLYNEFPTILLVAIVLLAVFRSTLSWWQLLLIIGLLILLLGVFFFLYARWRKKNSEK